MLYLFDIIACVLMHAFNTDYLNQVADTKPNSFNIQNKVQESMIFIPVVLGLSTNYISIYYWDWYANKASESPYIWVVLFISNIAIFAYFFFRRYKREYLKNISTRNSIKISRVQAIVATAFFFTFSVIYIIFISIKTIYLIADWRSIHLLGEPLTSMLKNKNLQKCFFEPHSSPFVTGMQWYGVCNANACFAGCCPSQQHSHRTLHSLRLEGRESEPEKFNNAYNLISQHEIDIKEGKIFYNNC